MTNFNVDYISRFAGIYQNKIAITDGDTGKRWTYEEVNNRAINLASFLKKNGVEKGDRLVYFGPNHIGHFDLMFAAAKLGAIFMPLNWRLKTEELNKIIEDAKPKFFCYVENHKDRIEIFLTDTNSIEVDTETYHHIVEADIDKDFENNFVHQDETALMLYTSGSTGHPKGVMISHRAMIFNGLSAIVTWGMSPDDSTLAVATLFHVAGLFGQVVPLLLTGGEIILQRYANPEQSFDLISKYKITSLFMVPTMYYDLMALEDKNWDDLSSVTTLLSGGAPPSPQVFKFFKDKGYTIVNAYGMTECGPNNFRMLQEFAEEKEGSVGRAAPFTHIKIIDDNGNEVPQGKEGELCISGSHSFTGYYQNQEATNETLIDGYVHTGDIAYVDADGFYYIVNRKKEMIITGGENVYPSEVEAVLNTDPNVKSVVVVGYSNPRWGESVAAGVILNEPDENYAEKLDALCLDKLAGYKRPKLYVEFDEFPVNGVGKLQKDEIQKVIQNEANK